MIRCTLKKNVSMDEAFSFLSDMSIRNKESVMIRGQFKDYNNIPVDLEASYCVDKGKIITGNWVLYTNPLRYIKYETYLEERDEK